MKARETIRVERGEEIKRRGVFRYVVPSLCICGQSRQPLLDACRQIKSILGDTRHLYAAIYRPGHDQWDARVLVDIGAGLTVKDGGAMDTHFAPYRAFDRSRVEAV